jgi:predicted DNA-binding transcriptional regulator AlpA
MSEIPFALRAINAEQCAELFGCAPRTFLERIACKPGFPMRVHKSPAAWVAGEVIEWRDSHRDEIGRRKRAA